MRTLSRLTGFCRCLDIRQQRAEHFDITDIKVIRMAQLLVRNLADEVVQALKRRAVEHGNSVEEEHRELLRSVLLADKERKPDLKALLAAVPPGEDDLFERSRDEGRPVDL